MGHEITRLQEFVDNFLGSQSNINILEAGCGSASLLQFERTRCSLVGIDISEKQLQRNTSLDKKILGDIQFYDFPASTFDIIICMDVLEHLPQPELALRNFYQGLKKGGIIVLKLPNVLSSKGLITKYTPYWFHLFFYKFIYREKNAGKDDVGPFPTYLKFCITPKAIRNFALNRGAEVVYYDAYDVDWIPHNKIMRFFYLFYTSLDTLAQLLSFHTLGQSEFIMVLKK